MSFRVRLTREAGADLDRLYGFVVERELERDGGNLTLAEQALAAIRAGIATLETSPFTCRKAGPSPFLRELIIPSASRATSHSSRSSRRPTSSWWPCAISSRTTTTDASTLPTECLVQCSTLCSTEENRFHVDGKTLRRDRGQEAGFHAHGVAIPSAPLHAGPARKPAGVGSPAPRRLPTAVIVDKIAACTNTQVVRFWPVGQDVFREALLDYWGGACAVTGLALPDVLRASHAKPWADCTSDEERLDVFNGFPLAAHLDALFDRGLISFDVGGDMVIAPRLTAEHLASLHLGDGLRLRWVAPEHLPFLQWHREHEFRG